MMTPQDFGAGYALVKKDQAFTKRPLHTEADLDSCFCCLVHWCGLSFSTLGRRVARLSSHCQGSFSSGFL